MRDLLGDFSLEDFASSSNDFSTRFGGGKSSKDVREVVTQKGFLKYQFYCKCFIDALAYFEISSNVNEE